MDDKFSIWMNYLIDDVKERPEYYRDKSIVNILDDVLTHYNTMGYYSEEDVYEEWGKNPKQSLINEFLENGWEYGASMVEDGEISYIEEWDDNKEKYLSVMDREFDYLWWVNSDGSIEFTDRLYSDKIDDSTVDERKENNEVELFFNNYEELDKWIQKKRGEENE